MVKSKEIFEKVRELKAQGKTGTEIAKEISISKGIVYLISSAIKNNCNSIPEYYNYIIKKIINPETGENFGSKKEYNDYIVRRKGFSNESSYICFRKLERKENGENLSEQEKFERSIKLFSLGKLDGKILENARFELEIENKDNVEILLNRIPDRYRKVLEMRYIYERSQEETANFLSMSYQSVQQYEKKAFQYFLSGKKIRDYKTYKNIEDGELLLVHILSRSSEIKGKSKLVNITDLDNKIYYDKNIRAKKQIDMMLYNKNYKKKLRTLKEKYFPLS